MKTKAKRLAALWLSALALLLPTLAAAQALPDGAEIVVPEGYVQGEPLPVYRATQRTQKQDGFFDIVQPEWFNQSGVESLENLSKRGRYDRYTFADEAELCADADIVTYHEYDGEQWSYPRDNPDERDGPYQRYAFSTAIANLASSARYYVQYDEAAPRLALESTALSGLTLDEADAQARALLARLGLEGYERSFALDMSVEHIRILGEYENKRREEYNQQNTGWWDFSEATEADEGYFLVYEKQQDGVDFSLPDDNTFYARAFVNADGVRDFELFEPYVMGDVYETPARLLTAGELYAAFEAGNARREKDGIGSPAFTGAQLMYTVTRASNKKDGMVIAPVWYVQYDWLDVTQPCDGWAWYSAVDGRLIMDCYS